MLTAGPRWQEVSGGDANAIRLIAICRIMSANPDPVKATETQLQLAELFERQGLFILAETTTISPAKRLALYRKRIDAAWPGVGAGVTMREDGKLVTVLSSHEASGFKTRTDVVDLEPIRGMPFAALCLDSTGVRKLDVLASMPLEELSIEQTRCQFRVFGT